MLFYKKKRIKALKEEYSKDPSNTYIAVRFNPNNKIEYFTYKKINGQVYLEKLV